MNPTGRFSNRVEDYVKYRPSYPAALITHLQHVRTLRADSVVADIGSGTGLLTELFLTAGNQVFGVEPNREMRAAGEDFLSDFPNFKSINGAAEATTLPDESIDLITAGQAFHWFDRERTKAEFRRILRPAGHVALIWNERVVERSPFLQAYEDLLHRYSEDYKDVDHRRRITGDIINAFFAPSPATLTIFPNKQVFDLESLKGRLLSSSYAPPPGHPNHAPMLADLTKLFAGTQINGTVDFDYETKLYLGTL
jgi:SAM-dependent methyltransferase